MTDWRHTRTERLLLDATVDSDRDDLYAIHSDPDSWRHFPSGRHTDPARTVQMTADGESAWAEDGLGYWSIREADTGPAGPVVGRGGCSVHGPHFWNLYYRLAPSVHRQGYAVEMGRRAVEAAHDVDADRPVRAFLVEHNEASRRTIERLGFIQVWRGPDLDNPDPSAVRLVYLDREPAPGQLAAIEAEMGNRPHPARRDAV